MGNFCQPTRTKKEFKTDGKRLRICVTGGGGFIGGNLARRLHKEGHYVIAADWKRNGYMDEKEFCSEFMLIDLRNFGNCMKCTKGCDEVYNLAADMGGMGFIQSNHSVILYNNTMISFNMMEAARLNKVKVFFYSSSACIYPEFKQVSEDIIPLKEKDAWPAQPQDAYGLEKLCSEELAIHYEKDFGMKCRIARFHNIYGPYGTWKGGREKAPAAFCRKALTSTKDFEVWGNGKQTRSFCYIDDCVEGILRIAHSDYTQPLNLGSDEAISMNGMAKLCMKLANNILPIRNIPGPEGVRGRNSDNKLIKKVLGWAPSITLEDGLGRTIKWIEKQIEKLPESEKKALTSSIIVKQEDAMKENAKVAAACK
mmetsp:Transcript_19778/g.29573  ORF Transcript_19778/g.29573 Transcript_19778/m.29573 type:complete len:368 (-) Transcript_19778:102-1205(-)|eukprot:CAMPEP_0167752180 /NCGR_PEP_ID=MMETSP0110_2-20121227/6990_1 /TAXON_ID=629695 /ORGANISM="Gymnochlora sp., Strain CCMP2014" /LENGTH=367 /DNA_ID=CAMNT_0007637757 /DNA_START=251 /DNA_END=1354 /DNA_ORIENTATION=+